MFANMKRFTAFLLALVMVFSLLPTGFIPADATEEESQELTQAAYAEADLIFDQLDAAEEGPNKKNQTKEEAVETAIEIVTSSESYVEGSLVRNGNCFTWWTDGGIQCVYSPRMREISEGLTPESGENEIVNEPVAVKGGYPTGNQVYLIGPYYGYDSTFRDQYKQEAKRVASAIGDTDGYTLYSGEAATLDKVAEAIGNGAVVFFDSHGMTDYENPNDEYDFVTGANNSYLCLTSTTGLTDEDYADGALYYSDGICINGATIANHMTKNSPSGILWMAICLGMATNTMCEPLREMGVEVVYGYSQSVSFDGDYLFEEAFWSEMIEGATVAEAIASMKSQWGNWDWSDEIADYYYYTYYESGYSTISEARRDYAAFPIVVSDEDAWPGQRKGSSYGSDSLQEVKSTYTLFVECDHVWTDATCTSAATCTLCGRTTGSTLPHTDADANEICDVCGKDISVIPNSYIKVTETPDDWSGQYLIVYEAGSLAFDGSLSVLEATDNGFSVTIEDDMIILDDADADKYFVIEPMTDYPGSYTVKSASGFYIGNTTEKNKVEYSANTLYQTDLFMGADGDVLIETVDYSVLRFNKAQDQMRFRFYKSASYANQEPVALYKLVEGGASAGCNHSYDSGVVTTAPTCTADGEMTYTCTLCGDTYTNAVPVTGHTWQAATCLAPKTCSVCKTTEGSTVDHADNNGDEACDVCGTDMSTPDTPVVPPVSGGNTYEKVTTAPTDWSGQYLLVYEDGSLAFDGSLTDLDEARNTISVTIANGRITLDDANAESYITIAQANGAYTIKTASGYYIGNTSNSNKLLSSTSTAYTNTLALDSDGSVLITSSGKAIMRFNAANDQMRFRYYKTSSYAGQQPVALYKLVEEVHEHEYTAKVTTEPTCTATGVKTYTCECGDSYTETIAALGHSYKAVVTAPTCTAAGYTTYTCATCGNSYTADNVAALGHTAAAAVKENEVAATCTTNGSYDSVVKCSVCTAEISRTTVTVDTLGHNYENGACTVCGAEDPNAGPKVDENLVFYGNAGLSFQDYIGVQLYFLNSTGAGYDDVYAIAVQQDPTEGDVTSTLIKAASGSTRQIFKHQVMAWSMAETFTITLYGVKDGVVYQGQVITTSVEELAIAKIADYASKSNANACAALVDMLNYGAAVQVCYNHNADAVPSAGEYASYATATDPTFAAENVIDGSGVRVYSNSISMQAKVEIQLLFKNTDLEGRTFKATVNGAAATVEYAPYNNGTTYTICKVSVKASQMRDIFTIGLYNADGTAASAIYNVSVEAYAKTKLNATNITAESIELINAMLKYGDSVKKLL